MSESSRIAEFLAHGWCRFPYDTALAHWVEQIRPAARACVANPENARWLRCGGTWFIGVNVLPNDGSGAVAGAMPIAGRAVDFVREKLGFTPVSWDRGQVSVVYPGYPRQAAGESDAALRYRLEHDAAHIDGVLREGPDNRRHLRNHHQFILGVPLVEVRTDTAPFVVWEGSHEYVRRAFLDYFGDMQPARWAAEDVTAVYHEVRRRVFERCRRVEITARPGEAYLAHRLVLHGIAPWSGLSAPTADGRMIVYFRPDADSPRAWLEAP